MFDNGNALTFHDTCQMSSMRTTWNEQQHVVCHSCMLQRHQNRSNLIFSLFPCNAYILFILCLPWIRGQVRSLSHFTFPRNLAEQNRTQWDGTERTARGGEKTRGTNRRGQNMTQEGGGGREEEGGKRRKDKRRRENREYRWEQNITEEGRGERTVREGREEQTRAIKRK